MKVKKEFEKIWGVIFGGLKISFLGLAVLVILVIIVKGVCPLLLPLVSLSQILITNMLFFRML